MKGLFHRSQGHTDYQQGLINAWKEKRKNMSQEKFDNEHYNLRKYGPSFVNYMQKMKRKEDEALLFGRRRKASYKKKAKKSKRF